MSAEPIRIVTGYRPGIIGRCLELQARYYARHGFDHVFEAGRARDIADFFERGHPRGRFWSALLGDVVIGTIAIDAAGPVANTAQLRWFIVDDSTRGSGLGRRLLAEAVAYCEAQKFDAAHLWTFAGLDAARKLYEGFGFALLDEETSNEWGPAVTKQHFVRSISKITM